MGFQTFCDEAFSAMERNLKSRKEGLFWSAGMAIPTLEVKERSPQNGIWFATAPVGQTGTAGISLMLIPGELRVGAIIPKHVIDSGSDDDLVALSPDGNPHDGLREVLGGYLIDRSYQDDPFTPSWMVASYRDEDKAEAVALTMAAIVASTWKAAFDVIAKNAVGGLGYTLMLISEQPLPLDVLKQRISVVIIDSAYVSHLGHVAMTRSAHSEAEVRGMIEEAGLAGITVSAYEEAKSAEDGDAEMEPVMTARQA
jgi:hypothetical protein